MSCNEWRETELGLIPAEWEYSELKDKVEVIMGQSPKSEYYNSNQQGMPFLQGRKTFGEKFPQIDTWCINPIKVAQKGDVLLSVRAPVGDLNISNQNICIGRGLASLRMKNGNNEFLYYLLKNYRSFLLNKQSGTVFGSINKNDIENLKLPFPPLHEQKAIAKILSDLDEKIEINNRINKVLEEIAQTIFKRWFVDFEFPNENGEPYKSSGGEMVESELGSIPKGWEVVELGQFIEIINGYSYKSSELMESNTALLTIKNFDVTGNFKINGFKEIKISEKVKEKHYLELFDVVIACTDLTQNAEIIGNAIMVMTKSKYKKLIASMDIIKIVPKSKKITQYTLYMILKDNRFKKFALGLTSGTTVLHLNKKGILNYKVALPIDSYLLEKISCFIEPLIKYMSEIYSENERLSQLRDTLLPKLMSGEIRVPLDESK